MDEIVLQYNKETGKWEKRKEPLVTIEIETKEDYDELNKALDAYYDNVAYRRQGGTCSVCGADILDQTHCKKEVINTYDIKYCWNCGRRFVEEDERWSCL